jgi:hypothetical protein
MLQKSCATALQCAVILLYQDSSLLTFGENEQGVVAALPICCYYTHVVAAVLENSHWNGLRGNRTELFCTNKVKLFL